MMRLNKIIVFLNSFPLLFAFGLLSVGNVQATGNETIWGRYSCNYDDFQLAFTLNENGIENLSLNGGKYAEIESYDYLGWFGSDQFLEIRLYASDSKLELIRLLVSCLNEKVQFVSGYFAILKFKDLDDEVEYHKTIELSFEPTSKNGAEY